MYIITGYDKLGHILKNTKTGTQPKRTYKRFELQQTDDVTETITRTTRQAKKAEEKIQLEAVKKKMKQLGLQHVDPIASRSRRKRKSK